MQAVWVCGLLLFADRPEKVFSGQSEAGDSKASGTGSDKSKSPGASLDLTVNIHHEHCIVPTICPWVSEDACRNADLNLTPVTGTTNGYFFQIINSLIESWGYA